MSRTTRIGVTKDVIDAEGNFIAPGPGLSLLVETPGVEYDIFPEMLSEVTPQQIDGYDMVCSLTPKWTAGSLKGNDRLLSVHRFGVGYDMVDVPALTEAGVALCITSDAVRRPVAMAILAFMLALSTRMMVKDRLIRDGKWAERARHHGIGLVGKTLGVIGVGSIGHELFKLTMPLEMRHIAWDPYVRQEDVADVNAQLVNMDTLMAESDFVSVSCPLSAETHHIVGENELRKMKPSSFLINTSRGPTVDEKALVRALSEGWIQGAGLDVFEQEPTPADNPLLKMDNVILAPHSLAWLDQTFMGMWDSILGQIGDIVRGEIPSGLLNTEVWDSPLFQQKLRRFLESAS
ncbi:MAG: dehydrogenase [Dehalococcoidia bacterium]|nr:dehydrogenase [Dehalococcoidia bacterium]